MKYEQYLTEGATVTAAVTGRYIYLKDGDEIQVIANGQSMDIYRGFTFDVEDGFNELFITNKGNAGNIALLTSDVPFVAGVDGSKLEIESELTVKDLKVNFDGRQPVELPETQKVLAEVTNLPEEQKVNVVNMPPQKEVQKVQVVSEISPATRFVAHDTMTATGTISGNVNRKQLWLKAADGNASIIWLGGYAGKGFPLPPEAALIMDTTAQVEVLIPANCELLVSEVTA